MRKGAKKKRLVEKNIILCLLFVDMVMKNDIKFLVRKLDETSSEKGSCGMRRRLITEKDCKMLAFSHLKISDARRHYHNKTTEFYYVLKGKGELKVDEKVIPLNAGTLVMIKPGASHQAVSHGGLEVLIAMVPPYGEGNDIFYINDEINKIKEDI